MKKGTYKQYLYDPHKRVPKTTYYRNLKKNKLQIMGLTTPAILYSKKNCEIKDSFLLSPRENPMNFSKENTQVSGLEAEKLENLSSDSINFQDLKEYPPIDLYDEDDDFEKETDSIFNQLYDSFNEDIISQSDLAAGYLAAFFHGRTSQKSISDYLRLSNLTSIVKLPESFNGLRNLLMKNENKKTHNAKYFCNKCMVIIPNENKIVRYCQNCKSKYLLFFIFKLLFYK